jgi:uncharacterized protein (TIRG00374 family)
MNAKRIVQLLVSLAIGGGLLYFAFRNAPWEETQDSLKQFEWWGVGVAAVGFFVQFVVRSQRWAIQVHGVRGKPIGLREALAINALAFAAVFLAPFRLGELVRPYLSAKRGLMSASAGIANSAVERIVDGMVTTAFFGLVLVVLDDLGLPDEVTWAGWGALALFGTAAVVLVIAYVARDPSVRFWRAVLTPIHTKLADLLVGMLEKFIDGLRCFSSLGALFGYLGLSVAFWAINGAMTWGVMLAIGIDVPLVVGYFVVCFMVIAVMIPAPPGNLGNFHYFTKLALTLVGVSAPLALAFAVVIHLMQVTVLILWSGLFVLLGDVSMSTLREAAEAEGEVLAEVEASG